jgi:hypothetical protein
VESGDGGSNDGAITFTAAELQLGLFVLVAFLAYSVWVSYRTTEIWAFGVMGGVGASLLLLGGLYFFGGGGSGAGTDESGGPESPSDLESGGSESPSDSEPGSPALAASETLDPDEDGSREHAADAGVEPELLEDIIQRTDGGDPAAERLEAVLLEGTSSSGEDAVLEGTSSSGEDAVLEGTSSSGEDAVLEGTSSSGEDAGESSEAGFEFLDQDPDDERAHEIDQTPDADGESDESGHDE